jgi:hypothetical protein
MGRRDAASTAMTPGRPGRHGPAQTNRPPVGQPVTTRHPRLAAVLSALAAPASAEELAGERAAVAAFAHAQQDPMQTDTPVSSRGRLRHPARIAAVLAAGLVVAIGAGSAATASGALPPGLQQIAHRLLSPLRVPGPAANPARPASTSPTRSGQSATPRTGPPELGDATATQLCQAWTSEQKDPHGTHTAADALKDLLTRAGNPTSVPKFCTGLLGHGHDVEPSAPASVAPNDAKDHANPHPRGSPSTVG